MATTATDLLPTPSVTPPPPVVALELPVEINTVTRKHHIELNRLIIDRLPLALPPIANSPKVYALGLSAFAHIYLAFEQAFDDLERSQDDSVGTNGEEEADHQRKVKAWLANLRPPGLKRSSRIKRDLQYLPELDRSSFSDLDNEIHSHIRDLAASKPHILVAYTWVMYMAIFSGGRWIRSQLAGAQPEFWTSHTNAGPALAEKTPLGMPGFSFLSFDGDEDGEDNDSDASSLGGIQLGGPKPGEQPKPNGDDDGEEEHDPFGLPPSDDEEEMAELRRRVLASKPFTNPSKPAENNNDDTDPKAPERIQRAGPAGMPADSDAESGSDIGDNDDDEFDNIMNAAPMTDRAGISAAKRKKQMEKDGKLSVRFSRAEISAPVKGQ